MSADFYPDDEVINANQTPPLVATKVSYTPRHTPAPFVDTESSGSEEDNFDDCHSSDQGRRTPPKPRKRKGRTKTKPSQGDGVLIGILGPNYPEVAAQVSTHALESASDGEEEVDGESAGVVMRDEPSKDAAVSNRAEALASSALAEVNSKDAEMKEAPQESLVADEFIPEESLQNGSSTHSQSVHHESEHKPAANSKAVHTKTVPPLRRPLDIQPPPRDTKPLHRMSYIPPLITTQIRSNSRDEDDSDPISPNLAKYAITPAFANPDDVLPAMQASPPRSSSIHSPESTQTLPSLHSALSQLSDSSAGSRFPPISTQSPNLTRPSPSHVSYGPSPASYTHPSPGMSPPSMSPPGMPPHTKYWHTRARDASMSTPSSEYQSTPSSSASAQSPPGPSYPTPRTKAAQSQRVASVADSSLSSSQSSHPASATSATAPAPRLISRLSGTGQFNSYPFKCTYAGCNALPFQTQYLLNSHTNVHSSSRPHFCPVDGCPRGPGGKGFKRKNEMIRHGLVHDSPGYICPFCPDQQHRYPRPDNLQRHVRVHHVDKDRDHPLLRLVLAQRPEGGNRGRRRRNGG